MDRLKARDARDVEQAVRDALGAEQPLEIVGHGTKRNIGLRMATNALLDLSALNAVTLYEPNELVLTVQAGAPMADVLSLIDSKNQQFAFEPMDTSLLLGTAKGRKIAVLGDMLEMGEGGIAHHAGLAVPIDANKVDLVFASGAQMKALWDALPASREELGKRTSGFGAEA